MFCVPGTVMGVLCLPALVSGGIMGVFITAILWIAISGSSLTKWGQHREDPHGDHHERGRQGRHPPESKPPET